MAESDELQISMALNRSIASLGDDIAAANCTIARQAEVIARMQDALKSCMCPRPANGAPSELTAEQCVARGECGCDNGTALALCEGK